LLKILFRAFDFSFHQKKKKEEKRMRKSLPLKTIKTSKQKCYSCFTLQLTLRRKKVVVFVQPSSVLAERDVQTTFARDNECRSTRDVMRCVLSLHRKLKSPGAQHHFVCVARDRYNMARWFHLFTNVSQMINTR
jgi:hypothetical protein